MLKLAVLIGIFLPIGMSAAYLLFQRGKLYLEEKRLELDAKRDAFTQKMLYPSQSETYIQSPIPQREKFLE